MAEPEVEEEVIEIDLAELKKLKVPELKRRLAEFGLDTKGTKAELLARVEKYLHEQEEDLLEEELGEEEQPGGEEPGGDQPEETGNKPEEATGVQLEGENSTIPPQEGEVKTPPTEAPAETKVPEQQSTDVSEQNPVSVKKVMTPSERMQARAQRFDGNISESAKKLARAKRFDITSDNGYQGLGKRPPTDDGVDRMKKRAERFGTSVSPAMAKVDELDRKKKRQERFGLGVTELSQEDRKKRREERFGASKTL